MMIFLWFALSIAVGVFASNRGRSGFGWFFLSLLFSPLVGLIFVAVMKNLALESEVAAQAPSAATHAKCPACAEWVLREATLCKHCKTPLTPATVPMPLPAGEAAPAKDFEKSIWVGILIIGAIVGLAAIFDK